MSKPNGKRTELRFDEWDAVLADLETLQSVGYNRVGQLDLGQICNHLAIIMEGALDGFPKMMPWPMRKLLRVMFLGTMMKHKPIRLRVPVAPAFAAQTEPVDDAVGVSRLQAAIARFSSPDAEYHEHLAFGRLNREQWNRQQLWHCEHHLGFLIPRNGTVG